MKREYLERYLGKKVVIVFQDKTIKQGVLHKGPNTINAKGNFYILTYNYTPCFSHTFLFRLSHVKDIGVVD